MKTVFTEPSLCFACQTAVSCHCLCSYLVLPWTVHDELMILNNIQCTWILIILVKWGAFFGISTFCWFKQYTFVYCLESSTEHYSLRTNNTRENGCDRRKVAMQLHVAEFGLQWNITPNDTARSRRLGLRFRFNRTCTHWVHCTQSLSLKPSLIIK